MLISLSKRFVFISNSKTASTSFEKVLDPYAEIRLRGTGKRKHATWSAVREEFHFLFDHPHYRPESFFRFGVIRDPVEWFVSWYNYRMGLSKEKSGLPAGTTFAQYWHMNDWTKMRADGGKHLQKAHFVDADGRCTFDLVMPMDMLKEYEAALFARIGVDERLPVSNKSKSVFSSSQIPDALSAEIRDFWQEDYEFIEMMRGRVRNVLGSPPGTAVVMAPPAAAGLPLVKGVEKVRVEAVVEKDNSVRLRGSVICAATTSPASALHVRAMGRRVGVQWKLPSPKLARTLPDNPRATHARFSSEPFPMGPDEQAELYIDIPGSEPQLLAAVGRQTVAYAPGSVAAAGEP